MNTPPRPVFDADGLHGDFEFPGDDRMFTHATRRGIWPELAADGDPAGDRDLAGP